MGGGLMQLVAYGAQDVYLTGNPQVTFWKVVYRRHTNFSMESIEQTFNGTADFGKKVTCTISRNGDLMYRVYLQVNLPLIDLSVCGDKFRWLNWLGHVLISYVEVEIGGQRIDRHYGDWLHIWNELTQTAGKKDGYASMVGNVPRLTQVISCGDAGSVGCNMPPVTLYIPLQFWFCRNPGLALPLIALQYHEVKINLEFRDARSCYWAVGAYANSKVPQLNSASLYVDYIYLDTDERRRFAQVSHEYLIEQLQYTGSESTSNTNNKIKLNFNHPCKELVWVVQPDDNTSLSATANVGGPQWFNYTDALDKSYYTGTPSDPLGQGMAGDEAANEWNPANLPLFYNKSTGLEAGNVGGADACSNAAGIGASQGTGKALGSTGFDWTSILNPWTNAKGIPLFDVGQNPTSWAKLQLNGHDRFSGREGRYFNLVQPYQHHENVPEIGINVYSFALKPEEHQPSGTCNMSRIDNATLQLILTKATVTGSQSSRSAQVRIYATNYNVLRVMSGMGGLAYSN